VDCFLFLLAYRILACRLVPILVNLEDRAGPGVDIIFILKALVEELHLVDQAAVFVVNRSAIPLFFVYIVSIAGEQS